MVSWRQATAVTMMEAYDVLFFKAGVRSSTQMRGEADIGCSAIRLRIIAGYACIHTLRDVVWWARADVHNHR